MKLSNLGLKTRKNIGSEDCYISELLEQSGQLKKYSAGCFGFGTMLLKIKRNIEDIIRNNLDEIGCAEVQYSILQAKNYWNQVVGGTNMSNLAQCLQVMVVMVIIQFAQQQKNLVLLW